jgi:hypothetical protein
MSDSSNENTNQQSSPKGISIHTETIAKGALRIKTKIWMDDLDIEIGTKKAVQLYHDTLAEFRNKGYKIDGDT